MIARAGTNRGAATERGSFLLHLALSAIAIPQPFYSVTGTTLNFFVAWRMSGIEFAAWILLIYAVPPLLTYLLVTLGSRLHRYLGRALAFIVFATYIWLAVTNAVRQLARQAPFIPGSEQIIAGAVLLALSGTLAWLLLSKPGLRGVVRLLGVMTVVFPALMLLRGTEFGVIQLSRIPPPPKLDIASRPNVVLIVYDEFPLTTILDGDGLIDKEKFPNFHQLAQGSTWFADARSVSGETETAVPAIMSGRLTKGDAPATYGVYPKNIFYMLGASYNVLDLQTVTNLNPFGQSGDNFEPSFSARTWRIARDVAIIYAHIVTPPQFVRNLPPINRQHNRFGEDIAALPHGTPHHQRFIAALSDAKQPFLAVYHNIYPHNGWSHYPSGTSYPPPRWGDYISLDRKTSKLSVDNARIMHDTQAHLLQSMHADKLLGEIIARLKATGAYDHSMIVVVADHGVSLWPGEAPRDPNVSHKSDVAAIPLLVKLPEQANARVSLDEVTTIDVYPTILDYLGFDRPEDVQGTSFLNAIRQAVPAETVKSTAHRADPTLKRRLRWFGTGVSSADLYGFGEFRNYIGRSVGEFQFTLTPGTVARMLGPNGVKRTAIPDSARIDVQITGGKQDGETRNILVALGDRFCGATRTTDLGEEDVANSFTLILAEECLDGIGTRELRVFAVDAFDHLAEIPVDRLSADRVVAEVAKLIGELKAAEDNQQRRMTLSALRARGVAVPDALTGGSELAGPWGDFVVSQDGPRWVLDFYSVPESACATLLLGANQIEGVAQLATSAASKDEADVPVTPEHVKQACAQSSDGFVRIIVANRPTARDQPARQVSPDEVVAATTELIGALRQSRIATGGRIELQTLRKAGVTVPGLFTAEDRLSLPWGAVGVQKDGKHWIVDLYSAPKAVCTAVLLGMSGIPAVTRVATTGLSKDETKTPVSADFAEQNCREPQADIVRIISTDDASAAAN
ncbi:sulfatase-like hydrolase/transferase [Bradyrhizobium sp. 930_D9_N1_4]|uniref:sulfatase-like hydrolase/transferase n=1 Tax=Bradyrhizobium sp. 930_D9_N1_4 TaxID=3240374 RepID=UPI003F8A29E9